MAASEEDHPNVYGEDIDEDDDDDSEDEDLVLSANPPPGDIDDDVDDDVEDDDDSSSSAATRPPHPSSASQVTVAVAGIHNGDPIHPSPAPPPTLTVLAVAAPDLNRQRLDDHRITPIIEEKKPLAVFDESRRLFQRLWTDEDEIELLQGFLDYTTQRGGNNPSHHHDTTVFYDQIKSKLQLDFNKNQLVEKLRRLKKKYRNVVSRTESGKDYVFKTPHDQATFEISKRIWGPAAGRGGVAVGGGGGGGDLDDDEGNPSPYPNSVDHNNNGMEFNSSEKKAAAAARPRKRSRSVKTEEAQFSHHHHHHPHPQQQQQQQLAPPPQVHVQPQFYQPSAAAAAAPTATSIPNLIEETVRSCLSPLFKELLQNATTNGPCGSRGFGSMAVFNPIPFNLGGGGLGALNFTTAAGGGDAMDEKWRKQQILELEVYSKRLELVQDQIKSALQDLRSAGS